MPRALAVVRWAAPLAFALALVFPASVFADAPTADDKPSEATLEGTPVTITMSGGDTEGAALTFNIGTGPTNGSLSNFGTPLCDGNTPSSCTETVDYTPNADFSGSDSFTYTTNDGSVDSLAATVSITVNFVNDAPSFSKGADQTINEDAGAQSVPGWATSISPGPSNESSQTVHFNITNVGTPGLFSVAPAVAADGTLSYTPAADTSGSSTVTLDIQDNGGTANGGVDTSATQQFTITVNFVNDAPSFSKGADQVVLTDASAVSVPAWASAISPGPSNESSQTVHFNVTNNSNPGLFSVAPAVAAGGTLSYTIAGTTGSATVTLDIQDNGGTANGGVDTSATQQFTITVTNLAAHNDSATIPEGAPATAIPVLANDDPSLNPPVTLTITAIPTAPTHGTVAITGGGTGLTYKPSARYFGSDLFTYRITHGALTADATVVVTVSKDATPPVEAAPVEQIYTGTSIGTSTVATRISWSAVDPGTGVVKYEVWRQVDGGSWTLLSLPTATTAAVSQSLSFGHTYRYRARATDFNGNVSTIIYGPAFHTYLYQDTNTAVHYGGTWTSSSNVNNSGGTTHYTSTAGRYATFAFYGRDFAFVSPTSSTRGSLRIYVDGVLVATISERTSSTLYRRVLWQRHYSSLGTHTIKIVAVGGARIDLDCFLAFR
ncbi:MAG TPA: Ig-like domain-containing protein [Candidatus Limnocylindrales bacterium]|nr:Ig-like domain-containing protein [Candidatus Limnocylindrales bacterium]